MHCDRVQGKGGASGEENEATREAGVTKEGNIDTSEAAKENKEVRPALAASSAGRTDSVQA